MTRAYGWKGSSSIHGAGSSNIEMAFEAARPQHARNAFKSRSLEAKVEHRDPGRRRRLGRITGALSFHNDSAPVLAQHGVA